MHAIKPLHVEMLSKSALAVARCCRAMGLGCRDPPIATTGLLYSLGYSQYQVRSLWEALSSRAPLTAEVYRFHGVSFRLVVEHSLGPVYEARCPLGHLVPLDPVDAERKGETYTPHSHRAHAYLEGGVGGARLRVNVVRLLFLLDLDGLAEPLVEGLVKAAYGNPGILLEEVATVLDRYRALLDMLLPWVPGRGQQLARASPAIRRLLSGRG